MRVRRRILGDAHVDRATANAAQTSAAFQDLITRYAWGAIWTRPGLDVRTRRLLVLAITASMGRWEEFRLHARSGFAQDLEWCDVEETLLQTAVYAGVPAANTGFHAAADERKNIPNILKAAQLLAGKGKYFQLRLMGMDANEAEQSGYPQEVKRLGLGPQVVWMGKVSSGELGRIYGESDLLLYPSRWEGFGLPALEAFACGVPVVASDTTSLPEVAGNAALLVDPENPEAIANAVRRLMEKPALRRQLVQKGFKRARLFTWEKTARLTLKVYEQLEF